VELEVEEKAGAGAGVAGERVKHLFFLKKK